MLARILLIGHALSLFLGAWAAARWWPGAGWPAMFVGAFAIPVSQVLVFSTGSCLLAHLWRGERPAEARIGLLGGLGVWIGETAATAVAFLFAMPLERLLMRRDPAPGEGGPPVLLVHGYCENAGALWPMARRLRGEGFAVHTHNLEPIYADIDDYADALAARIAEVAARAGAPASVVCHSMGGLAMRACLRKHPGVAVARVVTLGTPHRGTIPAALGLGANARQMRVGGSWLGAFAPWEKPPPTAIFSWHDNVVAPQVNGSLEGGRNLAVVGVGHIALPWSARVQDLVVAELRAPLP